MQHIGPWIIDRWLGGGAAGRVAKAHAAEEVMGLAPGRCVALKVFHGDAREPERRARQQRRELELGTRVSHPNVVRTFGFDIYPVHGLGRRVLVMEYVEGQTLRQTLEELGPLPEELCRYFALDVARGLEALHAVGAIHLDLKPSNVIVTSSGTVKIMDLGQALLLGASSSGRSQEHFVGSIAYAAPEQFEGQRTRIRPTADLYALGTVLYELATGVHPHRAGDVGTLPARIQNVAPPRLGDRRPQLSPFFEELVHTLMAKRPDDRLPDAGTLIEVLESGEGSDWWRTRVQALRATRLQPLRRIRIPPETPLVGRARERQALLDFYGEAKDGQGRVVLVEGEPGSGRTRLLDELVLGLEQAGETPRILMGGFPSMTAATSIGAFCTAFGDHFGLGNIERSLATYLEASPALQAPFLALLEGDTPAPPLGSEDRGNGFVLLTRALAAEGPVLLLIDDLHLAPEAGRDLFVKIGRAIGDCRVLLVGTADPTQGPAIRRALDTSPHLRRVHLDRLPLAATRRLLEEAVGSEGVAAGLLGPISARAEGNPRFIFEILGRLREEGTLTREGAEGWTLRHAVDDVEVPGSLSELVHARLLAVTPEEREVLEAASCQGTPFDPDLLATVLEWDPIHTYRVLAGLERNHQLVRAVGPRYAFDHREVQRALYRSLHPMLKEEYHTALALKLEAQLGAQASPAGPTSADVCEQFLKGGDAVGARRHLSPGLERLEASGHDERALEFMTRALALKGLVDGPERIRLLLRQTDIHDLLGNAEAQRAALDEVRDLVGDDPDLERRWAVAEERLAYQRGEMLEAERWNRRIQDIHRQAGEERELLEARIRQVPIHFGLGRSEAVLQSSEACYAEAGTLGDAALRASAASALGIVYAALGRYDAAVKLFEEHLEWAREAGDRHAEAKALGNLGVIYNRRGDYDLARSHFDRQMSQARTRGDRRMESVVAGNLGNVCSYLGDLEGAAAYYRESLRLSRETKHGRGVWRAASALSTTLLQLGRGEEAERYRALHQQVAAELDHPPLATEAEVADARGLLVRGHCVPARDLFDRAVGKAREQGDRPNLLRALAGLGRTLYRLGKVSEAAESTEQALDLALALGNHRQEETCRRTLGEIHLAAGRFDDAEEAFMASRDLARRVASVLGEAAGLLRLGQLALLRGKRTKARAHLTSAATCAQRLPAIGILLRARAMLAILDGQGGEKVEEILDREAPDLLHFPRLELHVLLWAATRSPSHLDVASRLLETTLAPLDPQERESALRRIPLYRSVAKAAQDTDTSGR